MSTTHHVKMAKASQKDIDGAIELYQFLRAMSSGRSCPEVVDEFGYKGYEDLLERDAADVEFALRAHERGDLFRVVWGLQVLLDPENEVVDPNLPHLELHPKHGQAAEDRDAARAEAERLRAELTAIHETLRAALGRMPADPTLFDVTGDPDGAPTTEWTEASCGLIAAAIEASRRAGDAAEQPKPEGGA